MKKVLVLLLLFFLTMSAHAYTQKEASDILAKKLLNSNDTSALVKAIKKNDIEMVRLYVDAGQIDLNESHWGIFLLQYAIISKKPEAAMTILKGGADPSLSEPGNRPLFYAVKNNYTDVVQEMLKTPNINIARERPLLRAPLITTAKRRNNAKMEEMLINYKKRYDAIN